MKVHNTLFFQIDPSLFHLFAISFCTKMVCLCKIIRNNRDGLNITSMNILSFPLSKDVIPCNGILSFLSLHVQLLRQTKVWPLRRRSSCLYKLHRWMAKSDYSANFYILGLDSDFNLWS